ncbi:MAG: hypothetical protein GY722_13870 [bacterium]|nr:hypothetical protein [bacterium]
MRHLACYLCLVVAFALCAATPSLADDDIGPIYKSREQTLVCMVLCSDGPCELEMTISGPEGNVLKSKVFANVTSHGIRKLVYSGAKNAVSCRTVTRAGVVGEPSWTILDRRSEVVAMGTNDTDQDPRTVGPVWNARNQTPVCLVKCSFLGCGILVEIRDSEGQLLKEKTFRNVPEDGIRMLAYDGLHKMISCEADWHSGASGRRFITDPAWVILDVKSNVVAYMTNDSTGFPD